MRSPFLLLLYFLHHSFANDADFFPSNPPTKDSTKPGTCPPPKSVASTSTNGESDCKSDGDCGAAQSPKKCCESQVPGVFVCEAPESSTGRPAVATTRSDVSHPGTCPTDINIASDSCKASCSVDDNCGESEKCCFVETCQSNQCLRAVEGATAGTGCLLNNKLYLPGDKIESNDVPDDKVQDNPDNYACVCEGAKPRCSLLTSPVAPTPTEGAETLRTSFSLLVLSSLVAILLV